MLKNRFEHVLPADYDSAAVLVREVADQMLERLDLVALKPKRVMDVGCGTGYCSQLLKQRYPDADIIAVDDSAEMLTYAQQSHSAVVQWCFNPLDTLPAADQSIDLLVANLMLTWCDDFKKMMEEWRRVLRPEGLLMFSTYGLDTLHELQEKNIPLPCHLMDMHNLGDALVHAGFADPVLDVEYFTLTYKEQQRLQKELQLTGFISQHDVLEPFEKNSAGVIPLTYEIVYGHAWKPEATKHVSAEDGIVKFPLSHLRGR